MIKSVVTVVLGLWVGSGSSHAGEYELVMHPLGKFHTYRAQPSELRLHWKGKNAKPLRTVEELENHVRSVGREIQFATNAGIFEPGGIPSGLHVQEGVELRPINLQEGRGNFFLKPNGVFFIQGDRARVLRSEVFSVGGFTPRLALQSGPMLVINGEIHPVFRAASEHLFHRNGIGVLPDGQALILMTDLRSQTRINLHQFARMFLDHGCKNALFLDGDLSFMVVRQGNALKPVDGDTMESRELVPGIKAGTEFGAFLVGEASKQAP